MPTILDYYQYSQLATGRLKGSESFDILKAGFATMQDEERNDSVELTGAASN